MADFDYIVRVGADTSSIANDIMEEIKKADEGVKLKIKCDDKDIRKVLNSLGTLDPKIAARIVVNDKSLKDLKVNFSSAVKQIQKEADSLNINKVEENLSRLQKRLKELKDEKASYGTLDKNQVIDKMGGLTKSLNEDDLSEKKYKQTVENLLGYYNQYKVLGGKIADLSVEIQKKIKAAQKQGYTPSQISTNEKVDPFIDTKIKNVQLEIDELEQVVKRYGELQDQLHEYKPYMELSSDTSDAQQEVIQLEERIKSLVSEIDTLKGSMEGSVSAESYEAARQDVKKLEEELEGCHTKMKHLSDSLIKETDVNDALTFNLDNMTDELSEAKELIEKLKSELAEKSSINILEQIEPALARLDVLLQEVIKIREAFGSIDDENGITNLLSQIKEISTNISSTSTEIRNLSESISKINLNVSINTGKNPIQQMSEYGTKATETIASLAAQYEELISIAKSAGLSESDLLNNALKIDTSGNIFDAYEGMTSKTKKTKMNAYNTIVKGYKQVLENAGVDLSSFNSKFTSNMDEVVQSTEKMLTTSKEAGNVLDSLFENANKIDLSGLSSQLDEIINKLRDLTELIGSGLKVNNVLDTADNSDKVTKEGKSLNELKTVVTQITEAVDAKTEAFKSEANVVDAVIESELTSLNVLLLTINDVIEAVNNFSKAFTNSTFTEDNPLLSSLKDILGKKDELENLATYIKSANDEAKKAADNLNNKKSLSAQDFLSKNSSTIESAASSYLDTKGESLLSTKMEAMSNGLIKITALTQNAEDQFSQYILTCSTKGEIFEKSVERGTAAVGKRANAYKKLRSEEENNKANKEAEELEAYNKALKDYYSLENKKNKNGSLSANDTTKYENAAKTKAAYEEKLNKLKEEGIELTEEQVAAEKRAADYQSDYVTTANNELKKRLNIDSLEAQYNKAASKTDGKTNAYVEQLEEVRFLIEKINDSLPLDDITDEDEINKLKDSVETAQKKLANLNTGAEFKSVSKITAGNLEKKIVSWMQNNKVAAKAFGDELDVILTKLKSMDSQADATDIAEMFNKVEIAAIKSGKTGISFVDRIKAKFKDLGAYLLSFASFYDLINIGKQAIQIVTELDDALTEMRKVSDEPLSVLKEYQSTSFDTAGDVGTTAEQLQQSTADWMRLGESLNDAAQSAQDATILLNVSEFESIDDATDSLVAMSQAYTELDKIDIVDKLNNIGNNFSISTDGLATGLQKSAAALKVAGNDMDEAIALITAGNAIVQDPDSVGAGVRTIALRIQGTEEAKAELESLGEDVEDYIVQTSSKLNEQVINLTKAAGNNYKGVSLLDDNGNYRSTYEILQDIADVYDEIVADDQKAGTNRMQGLLELLAGKNRSNIAASILQNGDMLREVYESSQNSEGSAQEELDKYLDSVSGKISQTKNKLQELAYVSIDSEGLKTLIDLFNQLLTLVTSLVDNAGLLTTVFGAVGGVRSTKAGFGKQIVVYNAPFYKVV